MNTAEIIYQRAKSLPEEQAKEVLNFLECLQAKHHQQATPVAKSKSSTNKPLPGFGMWANRQDINDNNEYLR